MQKICKFCKTPFSTAKKDQRFCSRDCWYDYTDAQHNQTCQHCGKPLTKYQRLKGQTFCSRRCFGIAHRGLRTRKHKACPTCGNLFLPKSNRIKYCSRECYYASYCQKEFTCKQCGKTMPGRPDRVFCSSECYAKFRAEQAALLLPYGPNWNRQRRKALKRANYTCEECGGTTNGRNLDVHHIIPFEEFGLERYKKANALSNLTALCRSCHMKAHADWGFQPTS